LRAILDRDGLAGVRIDRLDVYEIPAGEMHPCCASHSPHGQQAQAAAADAEPITEPGEMRRELARTRERGWAINDEEIEIGLRSIAVPFRDRSGATCAAVNISRRRRAPRSSSCTTGCRSCNALPMRSAC